MSLDFFRAVALLVGTQIGAGVLGLPYFIKDLGFLWGSLAILLAGIVMYLTALFLIEALYRTNPRYHLFELVEHYFGNRASVAFLIAMLLSVYGALSAYISGISEVFFSDNSYYTAVGIITWLILSFVVVKGLKFSSNTELAAVISLLILFFSSILLSIPFVKPYPGNLDIKWFFLAFLASIFAFYMHLVIPEVIKLLKDKEKVIKAVAVSFEITVLLYIAFSLSVIGVLGKQTPELSIEGIASFLGPPADIILELIAVFAMATSFIGVSVGASDMVREYVRKKHISYIVVLIPPLLSFLLGSTFASSIILGALGLVISSGIMPPLIMLKLDNKHTYLYLSVLLVSVIVLISVLFGVF